MIQTDRLEIRPAGESDRDRFVELFTNEDFMVFAGGVHDVAGANTRFDHMMELVDEVPFAKQPIVERSTGRVLGYTGVDRFELAGDPILEYGYRLCLDARGKGYATEAGRALLRLAAETFSGTIYAMIDPANEPSKAVIAKLGFIYWKQMDINGTTNLYRLELPESDT